MRYTWVTAICLCAVVTAAVRRQMTLCGVTPIMPHFGTDLRGHRTDVHENIIGGEEAVPFSYPWMASIYKDGKFICGGSIIDSQWILTAAHCVFEVKITSYHVVIGRHNLTSNAGHKFNITKRFNPHFDDYNRRNDIALLKLHKKMVYTNHIQPICLPGFDTQAPQHLVTTGWGLTDDDKPYVLHQIKLEKVGHAQCIARYSDDDIRLTNVCANGKTNDHGICISDDGGPLMAQTRYDNALDHVNGLWKIYGVNSWTGMCALAHDPGVFTKVAEYLTWISHVKMNN